MQAQPQSNLAARKPSLPAHPLSNAFRPTTPSVAESSGLAHDAGNLLAALGLYSDLLSVPGVLRPEHLHYATELRLISNRSADLIRRLIATPITPETSPLSEAAPLVPPQLFRRRNARASDLLADTPNYAVMLLSLAPVLERIAAGAASVTVTCPKSVPRLNFPSEIIERITVNLVRNAAAAIRFQQVGATSVPLAAPGQIRITLAVIAHRLQLTVEDNGPGMPPSSVEAYLNQQPLPLGANHGFGHRIIHELTAASHGLLSIRVHPGHGTTFCLAWPIPHQPSEPCPSVNPSTAITA